MKRRCFYHIILNDPVAPEGGGKTWTGVVEETAPTFMDGVADAVLEASKTFAAGLVDDESYSNDSAYLDELDRVARRFEVLRVCKQGDQRTYFVRVSPADDQEETGWAGHVEAVDEEDALFQAAWRAAEEDGAAEGGPAKEGLWGTGPGKGRPFLEFEDFLDAMQDYRVETCHLEAVRKDDAFTLVRDLADFLIGARDDRDALLDRARRMMRQAGRNDDSGDDLRRATASHMIATA